VPTQPAATVTHTTTAAHTVTTTNSAAPTSTTAAPTATGAAHTATGAAHTATTVAGHLATVAHHATTAAGHAATVAHHHAATVAHHHAATGRSLTGVQSVSASSLLIQMVVGLAVIIVLIKVASRLVRGRGGRALGHGPRPHGVSVVGRQSLGKGVQVAMVTAGRQTYLLGVTQRQVTLLGEVDTTEPVVVSVGTGLATAGLELAATAVPAALPPGLATVATGSGGSATATNAPAWKSAIEQMRVRTVRRA